MSDSKRIEISASQAEFLVQLLELLSERVGDDEIIILPTSDPGMVIAQHVASFARRTAQDESGVVRDSNGLVIPVGYAAGAFVETIRALLAR